MDDEGGVSREMLAAGSDWSQVRVVDCNGNSLEILSDPNIKMKGSGAMKKKKASEYMSAEKQAKMKAEAALISINDIPQLCPLYMRKAKMGDTRATLITDIRAIPSNSPVPLGFRLPDRCEESPIAPRDELKGWSLVVSTEGERSYECEYPGCQHTFDALSRLEHHRRAPCWVRYTTHFCKDMPLHTKNQDPGDDGGEGKGKDQDAKTPSLSPEYRWSVLLGCEMVGELCCAPMQMDTLFDFFVDFRPPGSENDDAGSEGDGDNDGGNGGSSDAGRLAGMAAAAAATASFRKPRKLAVEALYAEALTMEDVQQLFTVAIEGREELQSLTKAQAKKARKKKRRGEKEGAGEDIVWISSRGWLPACRGANGRFIRASPVEAAAETGGEEATYPIDTVFVSPTLGTQTPEEVRWGYTVCLRLYACFSVSLAECFCLLATLYLPLHTHTSTLFLSLSRLSLSLSLSLFKILKYVYHPRQYTTY